LSPASKLSSEDLYKLLPALQFVSMVPETQEEATQVTSLMTLFTDVAEKGGKKPQVRIAFIKALQRVVEQLDSLAGTPFNKLHDDVLEFYLKALKWATVDELKAAAFELAAAVLIVSPKEFFGNTSTDFLQKELFGGNPKEKKRPFIFPALLKFLRGKFTEENKDYVRARLEGRASPTFACAFTTKPLTEEASQTVKDRLKIIDEHLFVKKTVTMTQELVPIASDIVVQMAASSLGYVLRETLPYLLLKNEEGKSPEYLVIGLKALRVIYDPSNEFSLNAACKQGKSEKFLALLAEIPATYSVSMTYLFQLCDIQVGASVLGTSTSILEPTSFQLTKRDDKLAMSPANQDEPGADQDVQSPTSPKASKRDKERVPGMRTSSTTSLEGPSSPLNPDVPHDTQALYPVQRSVSLDLIRYNDEQPGPQVQTEKENIEEIVGEWLSRCEVASRSVSHLSTSSGFTRNARKKKQLKPDQVLIFQLYRDVLSSLPLFGGDDLLFGRNFAGVVAFHSSEELATLVTHSVQRVFVDHPEKRGPIISAYLGLLGSGAYQEDVFEYTVLGQLSLLSQLWRQRLVEGEEAAKVGDPALEALSCDADATLLCMLSRANAQIRRLCFKILENLHIVISRYRGSGFENGLHSIMLDRDHTISSRSRYAFLLNAVRGSKRRLDLGSLAKLLPVASVGASEVSGLWIFYLGEIARAFGVSGPRRAVHRAAMIIKAWGTKELKDLKEAKESKDPSSAAENEALTSFSAFNVLRVALAGVEEQGGEINLVESVSSRTGLVYESFAERLFQDIISDQVVVRQAVSTSSYFLSQNVIQIVMAEIVDWFLKEDPKNPTAKKKLKLKEFFVTFTAFLSLHPKFVVEVNKTFVTSPSLFGHYCRLLTDLETHITSSAKLEGNYAYYYCVIVASLCEGKATHNVQKLDYGLQVTGSVDFWFKNPAGDKIVSFDQAERVRVFQVLRMISDLASVSEKGEGKKAHNRVSSRGTTLEEGPSYLLPTTLMALERLVSLGSVFPRATEGPPAKTEGPSKADIAWFFQLERQGYDVVTPLLCYNTEHVIDACVYQGYSSEVLFLNLCRLASRLPWKNATLKLPLGYEIGTSPALFSKMDAFSFARRVLDSQIAEAVRTPPSDPRTLESPEAKLLAPHFAKLLFSAFMHLVHESQMIRNAAFALVEKILMFLDPAGEVKPHSFLAKFTTRVSSKLPSMVPDFFLLLRPLLLVLLLSCFLIILSPLLSFSPPRRRFLCLRAPSFPRSPVS